MQDTLDACTDTNVAQMTFAFETLLSRHSGADRHRFDRALLVVEYHEILVDRLYRGNVVLASVLRESAGTLG